MKRFSYLYRSMLPMSPTSLWQTNYLNKPLFSHFVAPDTWHSRGRLATQAFGIQGNERDLGFWSSPQISWKVVG